ncbi:MAG: cyclic nucleotide-binding domain-containing protein [Candidatus Wallbacteria bacterium]|nr:cyclic nucleotide-binding domain-containing protein [Candidatus Wallbacteria bacterium]
MRYLTNGKELFVPAGGVIFKDADEVAEDAVYYVMEGKIRLSRQLESGYTFTYELSKDGVFGMVEAITSGIRFVTATAETNSQLYVWDKQSYETALSLYIEFAKLNIQALSHYLRAINQEAEKVWINYVR